MFNVMIDYLPKEDELAVVFGNDVVAAGGQSKPAVPVRTDVIRFHEAVRKVAISPTSLCVIMAIGHCAGGVTVRGCLGAARDSASGPRKAHRLRQ